MALRAVACRSSGSPLPVSSASLLSRRRLISASEYCLSLAGRQLDGQRHAVEAPAEPDHLGPVSLGHREPGHRDGRAPREELYGIAAVGRGPLAAARSGPFLEIDHPERRVLFSRPPLKSHFASNVGKRVLVPAFARPCTGNRQRADENGGLTGDVERLAAGGEHGHRRRPGHDGVGQLRAGVDEVLAGVENQQQMAVAQVGEQRVGRRPGEVLGRADPLRDDVRQQPAVAQPGQFHQPHAVRVPGRRRGGGAQRHAGLADAAWTDERDKPRAVQ